MKARHAVLGLGAGWLFASGLMPAVAAYADQPPSAATDIQAVTVVTDGGWTVSGAGSSTVTTECANPAWTATITGAAWIWADDQGGYCSPSGVPGSAPAETATFTTTFELSGTPTAGTLKIAVDNEATVWINGHEVPGDQPGVTVSGFGAASTFDVTGDLVTGANTIAVQATNTPLDCGWSTCNPAGLLAGLTATSALTNTGLCRAGGWRQWTDPAFNDQGDCVSYVVSHSTKSH